MAYFPPSQIEQGHPDYGILETIAAGLYEAVGSALQFNESVPRLLRQALDEVIDTPRSARIAVSQLEKTEKTYIGTKVEILLRDFLGVQKGVRLDLCVAGHEVDIKNTVRTNWTIPREATGQCCLLVRIDEDAGLCWTGLVMARDTFLNPGRNRDGKRSFSAAGLSQIFWLLHQAPLPPSFWHGRDPDVVAHIMDPRASGNERVRRLFRSIQREPVPRSVVDGVARQLDSLKRVRKNGGARDTLAREGVAILSGNYDRSIIDKLGFPACQKGDFFSITPASEKDKTNMAKLFEKLPED